MHQLLRNGNGSPETRRARPREARLALPAVDHLFFEGESGAYSVGFLPSDEVSENEKAGVDVPATGPAGRQIAAALMRISDALPGAPAVDRVIHQGGTDFKLFFLDAAPLELAAVLDPFIKSGILRALHEVAVAAQDLYVAELAGTA